LVISEPLVEEVFRHLVGKFGHSRTQAEERLDLLRESATTFLREAELPVIDPDVCRDPDDLQVIATAVAVSADYVVSGDRDLLDVCESLRTKIVSPRTFWERLRHGEA